MQLLECMPVSFGRQCAESYLAIWLFSTVPCMPFRVKDSPLSLLCEITNLDFPERQLHTTSRQGLHRSAMQTVCSGAESPANSQHVCRRP